MTDITDQLLMELAVRGMVRGELPEGADALIASDLATSRGPVLVATRAGHDRAVELLRLPAGGDEASKLRDSYERFLPLNRRLREICAAWQTRPDNSVNDHSDPAYDARVRDDLEEVHDRVLPLLSRMTAVAPTFGTYRGGLESAISAIDEGDATMLTAPLSASYHTVWMWLHQELLIRLGIDRAEDERLEEALVSGLQG